MPQQRKVSIKVRITGDGGKRRYCSPVLNKQGGSALSSPKIETAPVVRFIA